MSISTTYNSKDASWYESMGIMVVWLAPNDTTGHDPFKTAVDTQGVLTHGHLHENDNHGGAPDPKNYENVMSLPSRLVPSGTVLPIADFVVLATPHTHETHRLLDARRLALLKTSAILVNVARGDVVDETALTEALQTRRLRGAALDVFEQEPLPADSPLWDLDNVFVSPHSASTVASENERIVELFCENLENYLEGAPLVNVLDKQLLY
jgi:lactate dehydrogenase-like 2-hydroxyacid dehydrogenase